MSIQTEKFFIKKVSIGEYNTYCDISVESITSYNEQAVLLSAPFRVVSER